MAHSKAKTNGRNYTHIHTHTHPPIYGTVREPLQRQKNFSLLMTSKFQISQRFCDSPIFLAIRAPMKRCMRHIDVLANPPAGCCALVLATAKICSHCCCCCCRQQQWQHEDFLLLITSLNSILWHQPLLFSSQLHSRHTHIHTLTPPLSQWLQFCSIICSFLSLHPSSADFSHHFSLCFVCGSALRSTVMVNEPHISAIKHCYCKATTKKVSLIHTYAVTRGTSLMPSHQLSSALAFFATQHRVRTHTHTHPEFGGLLTALQLGSSCIHLSFRMCSAGK